MVIEQGTAIATEEWLLLRHLLWPEVPEEEHRRNIADILSRSQTHIAFLARSENGAAIGFAEASVRVDYVNGCDTSPVAFLEGIYVMASHRQQGIARSLCTAIERWGRDHNCLEFASDSEIENTDAHKMHEALGFEEMERVVYFHKKL